MLRWRIVLAFAWLLRVPILPEPVYFGAEPVLEGQELIDRLREFFNDDEPQPPKRHLYLVK